MMGIKETKEALKFVIELGNGLGKSIEDGKFSLGDAVNFLPAAKAFPAAFSGIGKVSAEFLDLDEEERLDLVTFVKDELDIEQDKAEEIAEQAFSLMLNLFSFIQLFLSKE